MKKYFHRKSEMTAYAQSTGLEMIRCKQTCEHVTNPIRPAILLIKHNSITERLVKCKLCMMATTRSEAPESETGKDLSNE